MGGTFDKLRGGSRARLQKMRNYRDAWNAKRVDMPWRSELASALKARRHGAGDWRSSAHGLTIAPDARYVAAPLELVAGWRDVGASDDIVRLSHRGWYANASQDETYRGHVWQLPARDGSPVYVAGYTEREGRENVTGYCVLSCWPPGRVQTFDDKEDAARAGDSLAESMAETEREYSERWQAASEASDERDEARKESKAARAKFRTLAQAWRALPAGGPTYVIAENPRQSWDKRATHRPVTRDDVRDGLRAMLQEQRDAAREAVETMREKTARIEELGMTGEF